MRKTTSSLPGKQASLASLESLYLRRGAEAAEKQFLEFLPHGANRPYVVVRSDEGVRAHRTDVAKEDGINYLTFSPPPFWEVPYALLKAHFDFVPKKDFIYHGGEEILVPIRGDVYYHLYSNSGAKHPRQHTLKPLRSGSAILLNSQIPHHTWGGTGGAEAWMVIRHVSDTASAISLISPSNAELHATPRRIKKADLDQPGVYALIAWGIAEKIRLHRDRAKCRIGKLAHACGLDPSHLSRIENGTTNVSLETLIKIARVLRIGLDELIAPRESRWLYEVSTFPKAKGKIVHEPLFKFTNADIHFLQMTYWRFPAAGPSESLPRVGEPWGAFPLSWIVLKGRVVFEIGDSENSVPEVLDEGSVMHFRRSLPVKIQALKDSQFLQLTYSPVSRHDRRTNEDR